MVKKKKEVLRFNCKEGNLTGYKKVYLRKYLKNGSYVDINVIATLEISAAASVVNPYGRSDTKHRCDFAKVKSMKTLKGKNIPNGYECISGYDKTFKYKVGKIVKPKKIFSPYTCHECRSGIHFFLTKQMARIY